VIWLGVMAPKGTPDEIVQLLNKAINTVVDDPAVRGAWAKMGAVPMHMTTAQFDAYLRKDIEKWGAVVKSAGITPR
jgi:tripartite-type tricarboxylate transporter receptor subunit TctC